MKTKVYVGPRGGIFYKKKGKKIYMSQKGGDITFGKNSIKRIPKTVKNLKPRKKRGRKGKVGAFEKSKKYFGYSLYDMRRAALIENCNTIMKKFEIRNIDDYHDWLENDPAATTKVGMEVASCVLEKLFYK